MSSIVNASYLILYSYMYIQLKDMVNKWSLDEADQTENLKAMILSFIEANQNEASIPQTSLPTEQQQQQQNLQNESSQVNKENSSTNSHKIISLDPAIMADLSTSNDNTNDTSDKHGSALLDEVDVSSSKQEGNNGGVEAGNNDTSPSPTTETATNDSRENRTTRSSQGSSRSDGLRECKEKFEHGVYVTFIQLRNGTKVFRQVKFR